ncbi:hypothetical protein SAMN05444000_11610 [Shimia gijangensis]|uniref:Uncharacterized protein n=1 Tax=Shimia gijangensis TaxID=1470563 RepID=A0A1M6NIP4_9RHOB|nr:hypothetical protein SAMN05444000_11610 [Shimia gijangensis]
MPQGVMNEIEAMLEEIVKGAISEHAHFPAKSGK